MVSARPSKRSPALPRALAILGALSALLSVAACYDEGASFYDGRPALTQLAQQSLLGLSKKKVLACLGPPTKRAAVGADQIWTYAQGQRWTQGPVWAAGLNIAWSPAWPGGPCSVGLVIVDGAVAQMTDAMPDGGQLSVGQQCVLTAAACARP
jgi:hypothetical protein